MVKRGMTEKRIALGGETVTIPPGYILGWLDRHPLRIANQVGMDRLDGGHPRRAASG